MCVCVCARVCACALVDRLRLASALFMHMTPTQPAFSSSPIAHNNPNPAPDLATNQPQSTPINQPTPTNPITPPPLQPTKQFTRGSHVAATLELPDLGPLTAVEVGHNGGGDAPHWHCQQVVVVEEGGGGGGRWVFPCGRWLNAAERGGGTSCRLEPDPAQSSSSSSAAATAAAAQLSGGTGSLQATPVAHRYRLSIQTLDAWGAGTHSDVSVILLGSDGAAHEAVLEGGGDAFSRGKVRAGWWGGGWGLCRVLACVLACVWVVGTDQCVEAWLGCALWLPTFNVLPLFDKTNPPPTPTYTHTHPPAPRSWMSLSLTRGPWTSGRSPRWTSASRHHSHPHPPRCTSCNLLHRHHWLRQRRLEQHPAPAPTPPPSAPHRRGAPPPSALGARWRA